MRLPSVLLIQLLFTGASALLPQAPANTTAAWATVAALPPGFMQQSAGSGWANGQPPTTGRNHLPTSAMPHGNPQCSVDTTDIGGVCSATGAGSSCTATNLDPNSTAGCSVVVGGPKSGCSVENPGAPQNLCSALGLGNAVAGCTVAVNPTSSDPRFCSAFRRASGALGKRCSSLSNAGSCPVAVGNPVSRCTVFLKAPSGSCSVLGPVGFCSTFGGTPGTKVCRG